MKNELTLKHGVILATAVLLIAGCAFAGVAGATGDEPVHVTWSTENITAAGGNYIVDVPNNQITNLYYGRCWNNALVLEDDLILDFQNVQLSAKRDGGYYSMITGLLADKFVTNGSNLTVKNLIIDGGTKFGTTTGSGVLIGLLNTEYSSLYPSATTRGVVTFQNITIRNLSNGVGASTSNSWIGGIVGKVNDGCIMFDNVTIDNCSIRGINIGGLVGYPATTFLRVTNCTITNSLINTSSDSTLGGIFASTDYPCKIDNTVIKNSLILGTTSSLAGGICQIKDVATASAWEADVIGVSSDKCELTNNAIHNCVVIGGIAGGLLSRESDENVIITGNKLSYNTIVGKTKAAGFISDYKSTSDTLTINSNSVRSCCVVATNGDAAGFCL